MNCCLWLNGEKVRSAEEIYINYDPASLRGYFLGGSLVRWLKANGGEAEAARLEETGDVNYAFGIIPKIPEIIPVLNIPVTVFPSCVREGVAPSSGGVVSSWFSYGSGSGSSAIGGSGSGSGWGGYGLHII